MGLLRAMRLRKLGHVVNNSRVAATSGIAALFAVVYILSAWSTPHRLPTQHHALTMSTQPRTLNHVTNTLVCLPLCHPQ